MSRGTLVRSARWWAQRVALQVFRRLPVQARRSVVRVLSPTFTAGSIVVIERSDGAVLLIRQAYRSGWGLPGGLMAKGESPEEAAVREVREEVGLHLEGLGPAKLVLDVEPRRLDFVFRAVVAVDEGEEIRPTSPELRDARWFPPDALPELQRETRTAMDALRRHDVMPFLSGRHEEEPTAG